MFRRVALLPAKSRSRSSNYSTRNHLNFKNPKACRPYRDNIQTVILDNSGTCLDPFVIAPAVVFKEVFNNHNINITMSEAREPMGLRKDLHIAEILKIPRVKQKFQWEYGREPTQDDIDNIFRDFVPMQLKVLPEYCNLLPKVISTMNILREQGIKFGTTTGFNREMVDCIVKNTETIGLNFDTTTAGDDFPEDELHLGARPKPFMLWRNLFKLDAWPIESVVKVDDTITGIQEGINAGCWSVGITDYSNYMNIDSIEQWEIMDDREKEKRKKHSRNKIINESGAHYIIHEFNELEHVINDINYRLSIGEKP